MRIDARQTKLTDSGSTRLAYCARPPRCPGVLRLGALLVVFTAGLAGCSAPATPTVAPPPPAQITLVTQRGYSSATFQRIAGFAKTVRGRLEQHHDPVQQENYQLALDAAFDQVIDYYGGALEAQGFTALDPALFDGGDGAGWSRGRDVLAVLSVASAPADTQRPVYVVTSLRL